MNAVNLQKIDELTMDLNMDLCILDCAVKCFDENLAVCDLINFVGRLHDISSEIREIFNTSVE